MKSLKINLLHVTLFASLAFLASCGGGVQSGDLQSKFGGVQEATVLSPTALRLNWKKDSRVTEYQIYEASSNTPLQKITFDSITLENLDPARSYTFKVVGTQGSSVVGAEREISATTWTRFAGVKDVVATSDTSILATWEYAYQPLNYLVYVGVDSAPTAASTDNWKNVTATVQGKSYLITGVLPSKTYYVTVHAQYRESEFERPAKTLNLRSNTTFKTPTYDLSRISIGSLPFIKVEPFADATHIRSGFRSQAFWNGNPVSDPLMGSGNIVFSSNAGLPIGRVDNISIKFEYGTGAALESQTVDGLSTYVKGVASHIEKPQSPTLPQGAAYFGKALASGDFNCDGGQDLVVGAPDVSLAQYGVKLPKTGAVYIYYSKKVGDRYVLQTSGTPLQSPANPGVDPQVITVDDVPTNTNFGFSVSAGNINGDKLGAFPCDDLLVGAPGFGDSKGYTGAAFLYFGSNRGLRTTAHMRDMPINAESCDGRAEGASCVGVFLRPDPSLIPLAITGTTYDPFGGTLNPSADGWSFGSATAFIGDFDADGYEDIAIGAPNAPYAGKISGYANAGGYMTLVGNVSIYPGSKFGLGFAQVNGQSIRSIPVYPPIPEKGMRFGASIAGGADVDGRYKILRADGTLVGGADMIIGAPNFNYPDYPNTNPLKSSIGTLASSSIISPPSGGWAVGSVSLSANYNYYGWPQKTAGVGAAFLYYGYSRTTAAGSTDFDDPTSRTNWWACGNRGMTNATHFSCLASTASYGLLFPRDAASRGFGSAVALVGDKSRYKDFTNETIEPRTSSDPLVPYQYFSDANGDGYADIIVSAPSTPVGTKANVGVFWEFFGNPNRLFNGSDLYNVKAPTAANPADDYRVNDPICSAFSGPSQKAACAPVRISSGSLAAGSYLGATQSQIAVADVTGDGLKDLILGAAGENTTGVSSGAVLVFPTALGQGISSSYKKLYTGETSASDQLGTSVTAGNFNGDFAAYTPDVNVASTIRPYADVFAGAPYDTSQSPSIGTVTGWISNEFPLPSIMSASSNGTGGSFILKDTLNSFSYYGAGDVSIVGDVNGDEYEDAVTKITDYLPDGTLKTDAVVVFGSPYGLITKDFCLNNKDLIFTSPQPDSVCYPSISPVLGITKDDVSLPQRIPRPANLFGVWMEKAVRAGDINGDGIDDVLFLSSVPGAAVTVFFGARGGLQNVVDPSYTPSVGDPQIVTKNIVMVGKGASRVNDDLYGFLERNIAMTGDFNGDGYADIAIGQPTTSSPPMNNTPTSDTLARVGDSGIAQGAGWNCGVATTDGSCTSGTPVINHGMVWVFYGSPRGLQTPAIQGLTTGDFTLGGPGTIDMLNTEDVAATKPCTPITGQAGACQVAYMRNPVWENIAYGYDRLAHGFGSSVAVMKANKDAFDDLLVGSPYYQDISCYSKVNPPTEYGRIFVFYGSSGGLVAGVKDDYYRWERSGLSCPVEASADPAVGDPAFGLRTDSKMRAISPKIQNPTIGANGSTRNMGYLISNVGDVNGDGFEDFMVTVPNESIPTGVGTSQATGTMYLYYGPLCPMDNDPNLNDWFQSDILTGGQINLNRQTYVSGSEPPGAAVSSLYLGTFVTASVTATCIRSATQGIKPIPQKFNVLGANATDQFGYGLSTSRLKKGDFNGDGFDDVLIGSHISDDTLNGINDIGLGVVMFGSASGLSTTEYPTTSLSQGSDGLLRPLYITPKFGDLGSQFFKGNITSGDVNKDATVDYMIPSRFYNGTGTTRGIWIGSFFVYY